VAGFYLILVLNSSHFWALLLFLIGAFVTVMTLFLSGARRDKPLKLVIGDD
jgi:hypothetical protein